MATQPATQTPAPTNALVQNGDGGAVERVKYDPLAPIGSAASMKTLLERNQASIAALLPKHVTPERLIRTMLVAANRNPDLLRCTQASLIESIMRAAELGLDLSGTLGEAYIVPFKNKVTSKDPVTKMVREVYLDQAQMIPGYRGLAKLARQSGEIRRIEAEVVHEKDLFEYQKGTSFICNYKPHLGDDRGRAIGAYALVEFKDGGIQADFMTRGDVEKVRAIAKSKDSPAWRNHWDEMAKKTVFRRLSKWLPLSSDKFRAALEQDNVDFDLDALTPTIEVHPDGAKTDSLIGKISGGALAEGSIEIDANGGGEFETVDTSTGEITYTGNEQRQADDQRARMGEEDIAKVRALLVQPPAITETDLVAKLGNSLEDLRGDDGETPSAVYTRCLKVVQDLKRAK